jgi:hypothetical protein
MAFPQNLQNKDEQSGHVRLLVGNRDETVDITTIVLTRGRIPLLERALRSLATQHSIDLHVCVVIDSCPETVRYLQHLNDDMGSIRSLRWHYAERTAQERSGPRRVAGLRTVALQLVETAWCSFLDDDNELEGDHFSQLFTCARRHGSPVAHSWRSMWTKDGRPFEMTDRHPWCRDLDVARKMFLHYRDVGIYHPNSHIVRDQVVPYRRELSMVDTSEWLFESAFLRGIGFKTTYSYGDWIISKTEDNKLLDEIVNLGVEVPCTRSATLRYYLGGYSNHWSNEAAQLEGWI